MSTKRDFEFEKNYPKWECLEVEPPLETTKYLDTIGHLKHYAEFYKYLDRVFENVEILTLNENLEIGFYLYTEDVINHKLNYSDETLQEAVNLERINNSYVYFNGEEFLDWQEAYNYSNEEDYDLYYRGGVNSLIYSKVADVLEKLNGGTLPRFNKLEEFHLHCR